MEIAIISREREKNLLRCISFIVRNTILPSSIIIVKTGSFKNKTILQRIRKIIRSAGITLKYKKVKDLGISHARNVACSLVKDTIFAFLDDDEICPKNWIDTATKILLKHQDVIAVTGYKDIYYKRNYWNLIWKELCKKTERLEGYTNFATSSNTFYRIQFLRDAHITYDRSFKTSSEDLVLSQKIKLAHGHMWFSHTLTIWHTYRTSILEMIKQWFDYGRTILTFKYKYVHAHNAKRSICINDFIFQGIKTHTKKLILIPGLLIIDVSFLFGYAYQFICRGLTTSNR